LLLFSLAVLTGRSGFPEERLAAMGKNRQGVVFIPAGQELQLLSDCRDQAVQRPHFVLKLLGVTLALTLGDQTLDGVSSQI
jgi:hypothetical protein